MIWAELKRIAEDLGVKDDTEVLLDDYGVGDVEFLINANGLLLHTVAWDTL